MLDLTESEQKKTYTFKSINLYYSEKKIDEVIFEISYLFIN